MALITTNTATGKTPVAIPIAQEVVNEKDGVALTAAQVAAANVVALGVLPADCLPVAYVVNSDSLDSNGSKTVAFDFGILNSTAAAQATAVSAAAVDGGAKWLTASTVGQAGGIALHSASKATYDILSSVKAVSYDRLIGAVFSTGAATAQAGNLKFELLFRPA